MANELLSIARSICEDLSEHYNNCLRVFRNSGLQLSLFCPQTFSHSQIVVGSDGVSYIRITSRLSVGMSARETIKFEFEDPQLITKLHASIDRWLDFIHNRVNQ